MNKKDFLYKCWRNFNDIDEKTLKTVSSIVVCKNNGIMSSCAKDFADFYNIPLHDETNNENAIQNLSAGDIIIYYGNDICPVSLYKISSELNYSIEYRAYWTSRIPQPGMCKVLSINFETNSAQISNGSIRMVGASISELIMMKYTGFKDKFGRKIFFNDIIYDEKINQKIYLPDFLEVALVNIDGWHQTFNRYNLGKNLMNIEILGNIHENPELIKGISNWDVLITK